MTASPSYMVAPTRANEDARVALLQRLDLLDTPPDETFDRVTRLAASVLQVPIALVSLVDDKRQWFKSRVGLAAEETPRDIAFCTHAMLDDDIMVVQNALLDPRFRGNPLVTSAPNIRFYAGVPLYSSEGLAMGTLCVIDTHARTLSDADKTTLRDLAAIVRRELLQRESAILANNLHRADSLALDASKAVFQAAFQQAAIGFAILDFDGRFRQVNARFAAMLGYDEQALNSRHYSEFILPEEIEAAERDAARLLAGEINAYTGERRYRRHHGQTVWLNITVTVARSSNGQALHYVSVAEDVTARRLADAALAELRIDLEARVNDRTVELQTANQQLADAIDKRDLTIAALQQVEEALRASRETLQTITDNLPVLIGYIDADLRYQFNNATYAKVFDCDAASLRGRRVEELLPANVLTKLMPYFKRALQGERVVNDNVIYDPLSTRIWSATYIPHWKDGVVKGFYIVSYDVTERKQLELSLTEQALQDSLTRLPNRRALLLQLSDAMAQDAVVTVLFLDLDGFKLVNDRFGHEAGDALLKQVAERLRAAAQDGDIVSRLAGDEFVVVLRGKHARPDGVNDERQAIESAAQHMARDIIHRFAAPFLIDGVALTVGTSIGIACYRVADMPTTTPTRLLAIADRAMYAAKVQGENHYCMATAVETSDPLALSDVRGPKP